MNLQLTHYLVIISFLFIFSEMIIQYSGVGFAIIIFSLVLVLIIILFTYIKNTHRDYTCVFQMMILIPLYRIITLSVPIELITYEQYLLITTIFILTGSLILITFLKIPLEKVGLVLKEIKLQIICIAAGGVIGYVEWIFIQPSGFDLLISNILILALCAFTDELIFRGLIQQSIERARRRPFTAILLASTLYTIFYISYMDTLELVLIFLTSLFFGYVVSKSKSIVGVSFSHALVNICCFVIFPNWL